MKISELVERRERFKKVDGTPQMKVIARDFRNEFDLWKLKGQQIYTLLRECEDFVQLLCEFEVDDPVYDAAPELLEACKGLLGQLPNLWGDCVTDGKITVTLNVDVLDDIENAITKSAGVQ